MSYRLSIHPEARREFYEAIDWYEAASPGLGDRFRQEVLATLRTIKQEPETGSFIRGTFRQLSVPVFPFVIVYKVADKQKLVYVSSVFHTSRKPSKKFRKEPE